MATFDTILDQAQERLHDNGSIWTRTELLRWGNDGYREFLAKSRCVRRITLIDVPPRYAYTYCHDWESRFTEQGPARRMLWPSLDRAYACTGQWEAERLEGVTPTNSQAGHTQDWERVHLTDSDQHFVFALPRNQDVILRVAWDHKRLWAQTVKELDELDSAWYREVGEPTWWTNGTDRIRSIEVFEIRTDYAQQYNPQDFQLGGLIRGWSGSRTYSVTSDLNNAYAYSNGGDGHVLRTVGSALITTGFGWRFTGKATDSAETYYTQPWEKEQVEGSTVSSTGGIVGTYRWEYLQGFATATTPSFGVGTPRSLTSPDRQYWGQGDGPATNNLQGGIRVAASSEDSVEVWHVVVPVGELGETDVPDLLPDPAHKYLRYYILSRAFGRTGPGQNYAMAGHYLARFNRGVAVWKKLADVTFKDMNWQREGADRIGGIRKPYPRLPSTYEQPAY